MFRKLLKKLVPSRSISNLSVLDIPKFSAFFGSAGSGMGVSIESIINLRTKVHPKSHHILIGEEQSYNAIFGSICPFVNEVGVTRLCVDEINFESTLISVFDKLEHSQSSNTQMSFIYVCLNDFNIASWTKVIDSFKEKKLPTIWASRGRIHSPEELKGTGLIPFYFAHFSEVKDVTFDLNELREGQAILFEKKVSMPYAPFKNNH